MIFCSALLGNVFNFSRRGRHPFPSNNTANRFGLQIHFPGAQPPALTTSLPALLCSASPTHPTPPSTAAPADHSRALRLRTKVKATTNPNIEKATSCVTADGSRKLKSLGLNNSEVFRFRWSNSPGKKKKKWLRKSVQWLFKIASNPCTKAMNHNRLTAHLSLQRKWHVAD